MSGFNEYNEKANHIMSDFECYLEELEYDYEISFKDPLHDVARRFLNEINEFKPLEKGDDNVNKSGS